MKVIWEPEDIEGGLVLHKPKSSELFIMAYINAVEHMLVSLADGMVISHRVRTKTGMADFLNQGDWRLFNRIRTATTVSKFLARSEV